MRSLHEAAIGLNRNPRRLSAAFCIGLIVLSVGLVGCDPEMPMPPPRKSTNAQEDSFYWAMERMEHAIEMFRPPSSLGLRVSHDVKYELFPPKEGKPNYTALVTISTKAVFNHEPSPSARQRKKVQQDKAREAAKKLGLDDPFGPSAEERLTKDPLEMDEPGSVVMGTPDVADPVIPIQQIAEKKEYQLEYVDDKWIVQTPSVEEDTRMWFDYALQQGEYGLKPAAKP